MANHHFEDRPDPAEQPIRARVPDHVAAGAFSTGVIVMTAQSEFILDFVQNLGRPHQIVARVVMPHYVLPQLVDAMQRNIELYRNRWGELPHTGAARSSSQTSSGKSGSGHSPHAADSADTQPQTETNLEQRPTAENGPQTNPSSGAHDDNAAGGASSASGPTGSSLRATNDPSRDPHDNALPAGDAMGGHASAAARPTSVQEIYDDLKIRDEFLSGAYANAVMIGHGPHEFSFDFITNFYPHSAVSSRVFLAAGQIPRLFESLKGTWEQLRSRMQSPPDNPFSPQPPDEDNPFE